MMEIIKFDKKELKKGLRRLSAKKRRLFCLSICDRLYPNYVAFYRETKWGDPEVLKKMIDGLWNNIVEQDIKRDGINERLEVCEKLIPDAEKFESTATHSPKTVSERFKKIEMNFCEAMAENRLSPPVPGWLLPDVNNDGSIEIIPERHRKLKEFIDYPPVLM